MSYNPFSGPFSPIADIISNPEAPVGPSCPICKKQEFDAYSTEFTIVRTCRACSHQWCGGSFMAQPDQSSPPPPIGVPSPEDYPVAQYTGASYRNPSKNFEGVEND